MRKIAVSLLMIVCALALTAQTTSTTATSANETMGTNPAAKTHHRKLRPVPNAHKERVHTDAARLAALLADTQGKVAIGAPTWKVVANEANSLANKLVGATAGTPAARKLAMDARGHVREMHAAAMKGDAEGAKTHAGLALPFVYQLIDWSV